VIAMRLMIGRLAALTRVEKVGLLLLATAVLVTLVGYSTNAEAFTWENGLAPSSMTITPTSAQN
jgi:hypothetical protein